VLVQCSQAPLVADVGFDPLAPLLPLLIPLCLRVLAIPAPTHEKVSVLLIDCVISEMRAVLIQIRQAEGLGRKPHQALMVDVGAKARVEACHQDVYSQVEFKIIDEHRIRNVFAHYEGKRGGL